MSGTETRTASVGRLGPICQVRSSTGIPACFQVRNPVLGKMWRIVWDVWGKIIADFAKSAIIRDQPSRRAMDNMLCVYFAMPAVRQVQEVKRNAAFGSVAVL